jgi:hypothetical protein
VLEVDHVARVQAGPDRGCEGAVAAEREPTRSEVVPEKVVRLSVPSLEEGVDGSVVETGV